MSINSLLKLKLLKKVEVDKPSTKIIEAGNAIIIKHFDPIFSPMKAKHCQTNSICIVEAMIKRGENNWHIVPGLGFEPVKRELVAHVWVRHGDHHYDPTWSLGIFKSNVKELTHYQILQNFKTQPDKNITADEIDEWGRNTLSEIEKFAYDNNLKIKTERG